MTDNIVIALTERSLLLAEIGLLRDELQEDASSNFQDKLPDHIYKGMLTRIAVLENGLSFLDKLIIKDLAAIPLDQYISYIPKRHV